LEAHEVGVGYFDAVATTIAGGHSSTTAFAGSTEQDQFHDADPAPATSPDHDDGLVHHNWVSSEWSGCGIAI
jgi:isocitrate lyase